MQDNFKNNKRIAKNTVLLYCRMFLTMAIGLYTSRIVLAALGVSDYGIYNLVGGIVTTLSFLNSGMITASQRFISYELGKGNYETQNLTFNTAVSIHLIIAIIVFIIAETFGLWFINSYLNIDPVRMIAANVVYQCSIITFLVSITSVPYNASIIAHERMDAFAYISILDVVFKLLAALLLYNTSYDKLILYSMLILLISCIIRFCYIIYCRRNFTECIYSYKYDKNLLKKMLSFSGYSIIGNFGFTIKDQASSVILNIFFGTMLNAARGLAIQVGGIINTFASNLSMAINPQITKEYAKGNIERSQVLVYAGSKYTFYLLMTVSIPIIINIKYILRLWLENVPEYTDKFVILTLISSLLYTISNSVTTAIQATGNIKKFQIGISILMLLEIPLAFLMIKLGFPPYSVMYPTLLSYSIAIIFRFYLLKKMISQYSYKFYFINIVSRCFVIFCICITISMFIKSLFVDGLICLILTSIISILITLLFVLIIGLNNAEKKSLKRYLFINHK